MNHNQTVTEDSKKKKWNTLKRRRKMLLAWHQVTVTQISREMGLSRETVKTVVNLYPEKKSHRVQEYIAQRLGVPYERLWGSSDQHRAIITKGKKVVND